MGGEEGVVPEVVAALIVHYYYCPTTLVWGDFQDTCFPFPEMQNHTIGDSEQRTCEVLG